MSKAGYSGLSIMHSIELNRSLLSFTYMISAKID